MTAQRETKGKQRGERGGGGKRCTLTRHLESQRRARYALARCDATRSRESGRASRDYLSKSVLEDQSRCMSFLLLLFFFCKRICNQENEPLKFVFFSFMYEFNFCNELE